MAVGREERRLVTVLFADVVSSTRAVGSMGDELFREQMARFFAIAREEIERHGGTVEKFIGDAVMAVFGLPAIHEDDPVRAVRATLAIRARTRAEVEAGTLPEIRIGLNTGEVVADPRAAEAGEFMVTGEPVHLAARLQQYAAPGQILAGSSTYADSAWAFEYRRLPPFEVKGKPEKIIAYECLAALGSPTARRLPMRGINSPLVGREEEAEALMGAVHRVADGRGGIVLVFGEAGMGKSRLIAEARRQSPEPVRWLEGRGLSFGQTISYWPFLEIIKGYAGITEKDGEDASWTKLEQAAAALFGDDVPDYLPYLATLLALPVRGELADRVRYLDSESMGRQVFRAMRRSVEELARRHPLALVFEDWHWADHSSAGLLEHLLPLVEQVQLLVVAAARPDPDTPAVRLGDLAARDYAGQTTKISLLPLSQAETAHLVRNLLELDDLPAAVRALVLAKTEGNPFFVEEIVRALIDMKAVVRDEVTGRWQVTPRVEDVNIPDSLRGVIMARIDRLEEDLKELLKIAAVIGRTFFYRVLRSIAEASHELDRHLGHLQQLELIRQRRLLPELEYMFKHALTQEATYESIPLRRRRELHRRVGEIIEALFADRLEEFYSLLAYHYARAEDWPKAQDCLFKAGDRAGQLAADAEALAHYEQALAAYSRAFGDRWDPLQRATIERKMGEALFRRGEHEQAIAFLERAVSYLGRRYPASRGGLRLAIMGAMLRQIEHRLVPRLLLPSPSAPEDPVVAEISRAYEALGWIHFFFDLERTIYDAINLVNFAERANYAVGIVKGFFGMGTIYDVLGLLGVGGSYFRRSLALAQEVPNPVAVGYAHLGMGYHEQVVGHWQASDQHRARSAAAFWETGDIRRWGAASWLRGWVWCASGDFTRALDQCSHVAEVARDAADHQVWGWALQGMGRALRHLGELDAAVGHLQEAIELLRGIPDYQMLACAQGDLGACYLLQGRWDEGLDLLEKTRHLIVTSDLRGFLVTRAHRSLAEAYLASAGDAEGAERRRRLQQAGRACRVMLKQSRLDSEARAPAYRLRGSYDWLLGRRDQARRWWQKSLAAAESLGARYEAGATLMEIARSTGDREAAERAEQIFSILGAAWDTAQVRRSRESARVGG